MRGGEMQIELKVVMVMTALSLFLVNIIAVNAATYNLITGLNILCS